MNYTDLNPDDPLGSPLLVGPPAVMSALRNIFATDKNERLFNLSVSAQIEDILMDPLTIGNASLLYGVVADAIARFERRATLVHNKSRVLMDPENNAYRLDLYITIQGYGEDRLRLVAQRKS